MRERFAVLANTERSGALAMGLLLAWTAFHYLESRPPAIASIVSEARADKEIPRWTPPLPPAAIDLGDQITARPFVPPALLALRTDVIAPPPPPPPPPADNDQVVLKPKPQTTPTPQPQPQPQPQPAAKDECPLRLIGILKFDSPEVQWLVVAVPLSDPGNYLVLAEGDEWPDKQRRLKVVEVTSTSVVFQCDDGRFYRETLEPLATPTPSSGNAAPVRRPAEETIADLLGLSSGRPENKDKSAKDDKIARPERMPALTSDPEARKKIEEMARRIRERNPDLVKQLAR